jgi:hypothetical protein
MLFPLVVSVLSSFVRQGSISIIFHLLQFCHLNPCETASLIWNEKEAFFFKVFTWVAVPETRGKSLAQIQTLFGELDSG